MSATLDELIERVGRHHKAPKISEEEVADAVDEALADYSRELPRILSQALPDTLNGTWDLTAVVTGWGERHQVRDVCHVSVGRRESLDSNAWQVYDGNTLSVCGWRSGLLMEYAAPHEVTSSSSTIRMGDLHALVNLATAYCCETASRKAADKVNSSMPQSTVDYASISSRWRDQADRLREKWGKHVQSTKPSGGVFGEWDLEGAYGFPNFHRRRWH